ncbi:cytidine deaminase [bacterium]|nr:cytidine deaminase [bacterium]
MPTTDTDLRLARAAIDAAQNAHVTVSGFAVGAAALASDGRVFAGANVETPSLLSVICAERAAVIAALNAGVRDIVAVAVHAPSSPGATPCGVCRQFLHEIAPDARVLLVRADDDIDETTVAALLPRAFTL